MSDQSLPHAASGKVLSPAAMRALEEASERRKLAQKQHSNRPMEKALRFLRSYRL